MTDQNLAQSAKAGRRTALVLAGTGVFWIVMTLLGSKFGWSNRTRALFDLFALAGVVLALFSTFALWRARQTGKR